MRSLTPAQVLLFGVVLAGALVLALFPIFPQQLRVQEGDIASRTIRSPREATFESELLTKEARETVARAVPDVLVFDPDVRSEQLAALAGATINVGQVRANDALDDPSKRALLLGIVSRDSIDTVLVLPDERWQRVAEEARLVLAGEMSRSIRLEEEESHQDGLLDQISPDLSAEEANVAADLVRPLIVATLKPDAEATQQAREEARLSVAPVSLTIFENDLIVVEDQPITDTDVEKLEHLGLLRPVVERENLAAVILIALLAATLLALYVWLFPTPSISSVRGLLLLALIIAVPVLLAKVYFSFVLPDDGRRFLAYFLPLAAAPMLVATLLEARLAIIIGMVQAVLLAFAVVLLPDLSLVAPVQPLDIERVLLVYGLGAVLGVYVAHRAERLNQYVEGGVLVGVAALAALFALWLLDPERPALDAAWSDIGWMSAAAAASGLGSGLLTAGGFTAVGALLGVTTRVQLMELSQLNAPLLRRLQDEAPGTFHHSIIVGNLAERAADLVGADALLVRVGCYYHDIGKILQPGFYVENQLGGDNPHDELDPKASARIISQHVRAGLEMAQRHGLPKRVQAFIPEHHGTRLIPYFYRVASEKNPKVDPNLFRYPGPKPQSRETAIVMLADSTEATVRASADRSPERIDIIVEEVVAERMADGELEQCDLTLRDIRTIAESFKQTLRGVYHPRIEYPEPSERERRVRLGRFRPGRRAPQAAVEAPAPSQGQRPTW